MIFTKSEERIKSALEDVAMLIESINGKRIVANKGNIFLPHIEKLDIEKKRIIRENQIMLLNPLGYDAIKDIDEVHLRHRRKTD